MKKHSGKGMHGLCFTHFMRVMRTRGSGRRKGAHLRACMGALLSITLCFTMHACGPAARAASSEAVELETLAFRDQTYYLIFGEEQLRAVGTDAYPRNLSYLLQADIALSEEEWLPIGTEENPFTGTFNGNGFAVTGLTMKDPQARMIGFFGCAEGAHLCAKGAHLYNIILNELDVRGAGVDAPVKNAGTVCALAKDCRIYDNEVNEIGETRPEDRR